MAGRMKLVTAALLIAIVASGCVLQRKYNAKDLYERGMTEFYAGNYTEAAGDFKWALEIKREYAGPMIGLAQCHLYFARENFAKKNTGAAIWHLEEALFQINKALDADPGNPKVTEVRVEILKLKGEFEQTFKTAAWGVKVQGPNPFSLLLSAKTYADAGAYDEAEVAYKQAIAVAPNNPDVRVKAAQFYEKIGKRDLALQQYEEAYRLNPSDPDVQIKITQLSGGHAESQTPSTEEPENP
jgi:tetratricopeptide (TPR) repeat protein